MSSEIPEIEIIDSSITNRDGELVTNEGSEPQQFSRRALLLGVGATGVVALAAGTAIGRSNSMDKVLNWFNQKFTDETVPPDCPDSTSVSIDQFDQTQEIIIEPTSDVLLDTVEKGVKRDWTQLVVYPGILTLDPGVNVRTSPFLDAQSSTLEKYLYVQRPFLVRPTIDANQEQLSPEDTIAIAQTGIPAGTIGFFAPDTNEILYVDYNQEFVGIDRYSRVVNDGPQSAVVDSEAFGLPQERVRVRGRHLIASNIYPYIYDVSGGTRWSESTNSLVCAEPSIDFLVMMRSTYVDDPAAAIRAFTAGNPPVDIPTQK